MEADHADVIGHFAYVPPPPDSSHRFYQYDLLCSGSEFGQDQFQALWRKIVFFTARGTYRPRIFPPSLEAPADPLRH